MRSDIPLLLTAGILLAACTDGEAPSTDGLLVVSTRTGGGDSDPDGYLLTIDESDSLTLAPTGTAELRVPAGRHALTLLGVAEHCSVIEGSAREVEVPPQGSVSVAFEVGCPASAIRITTTTTGLDIDPDGYHVVVDGVDRGAIPSNGTLLTRVDPGSLRITLTDLAPFCTSDGPDSRTVTVTGPGPASIEFAIVCTAASGVIGVIVEASGRNTHGPFGVMIDEGELLLVGSGGPHYVTDVPGGDHVISLRRSGYCSVETEPQWVTLTVGEPVRDTAEVSFSVSCTNEILGTVRITAPTSGTTSSASPYQVWYEHFGYWGYGGEVTYLADLAPNDTLLVELPVSNTWSGADPYWYGFYLKNLPGTCRAQDPHPYPLPGFEITYGDTLEVEFVVTCPS
jgi:hypothetical protein